MPNSIQLTSLSVSKEPLSQAGFYVACTTRLCNGHIEYPVGKKNFDIQFKDMMVHTSETFHIHNINPLGTAQISFDTSSMSVSSRNNPSINSWSSAIKTGYVTVTPFHIIKAVIANSIRLGHST